MKKLIAFSLAAALLATTSVQADSVFAPPPPDIAGRAYILNDFYSGQTLAARDPDTRVEPASLTKLMTAYLTFKALKEKRLTLDQTLTVSEKGWKTEGSRMFLDPKIPATVNDLIHGMIIQSGNDACVTLAEAIAGSEEVFGQMMSREARRLGMNGTHFVNATGLPGANHYTTVRDLGTLANALIRDFPEFYPIYSKKEFRYNNITQANRNLLLYRDPNVDGMKTGYTDSAGYNLIASSHRDGRRVVSVVVGTSSPEARAVESSKLLNFGVQFFDTPRLYTARKSLGMVPVFKGQSSTVSIGVPADVYVSIPKGTARQVKLEMTTQKPLIAPIKAGQTVGKITMVLDGKILGERQVVALSEVPEAGFIGRFIDSVKLLLN